MTRLTSKLATTIAATLMGTALLTGCGADIDPASPEAMAEMKPVTLAEAMTDKTAELIGVLRNVQDGPSAEAALPEVAKLGETIRNGLAAIKAMPTAETNGNVDFMAKVGPMNMAQMEMLTEFQRIANIPDAAAVMNPEAKKYGF